MTKLFCARNRSKSQRGAYILLMSLLLCVVLLSGLFINIPTALASGDDVYKADGFTYHMNGTKAIIIGTSITGDSLVVPETVGGLIVWEIGDSAFNNCSFKNITLPDSVRVIGQSAFGHSEKLEKIVLPANLKNIKEYAFSNCTSLQEVTMGGNLTEIGYYSFAFCYNLKSVNIPASVVTIGESAFQSCDSLEEAVLNEGLEKIGFRAFSSCGSLNNITIPESVKQVKQDAFVNCGSLKEVVFKGNDAQIGKRTFLGCSSLEKVELPNNMKNIPYQMFFMCENLKEVVLPEQVLVIKESAFEDCSSLSKVVLNNKAYSIGDKAFAGSGIESIKLNKKMQYIGREAFSYTDLRKINLSSNVEFLGKNAFADCYYLRMIDVAKGNKKFSSVKGVLYDKDKTELLVYPVMNKSKTYVSPKGLKTIPANAFAENKFLKKAVINANVIGKGAFANMKNLKKVTLNGTVSIKDRAFYNTGIRKINIPSSLTKLGKKVFEECNRLVEFTGGNSPIYTVKEGVLYNSAVTRLVKYPSAKSAISFTVQDSVKGIAKHAFVNNKHLKHLSFGKGVKRLEKGVAVELSKLKTIAFQAEDFSFISPYAIRKCNHVAVVKGIKHGEVVKLAERLSATFDEL